MAKKTLLDQAREEIRNLNYKLNDREKYIERVEGQLEGLKIGLQRTEAMESFIVLENRWLRETLRLMLIQDGRIPDMKKVIQEELDFRGFR